MSEDEPPPLRRAHRAKRVRDLTGGIDGGAIAVGLVLPLLGFASILVIGLPDWFVGGVLGLCLFVGGILATAMRGSWATCGICHGMLVGVASGVIASLLVLADVIAESETVDLELTRIAGHSTTAMVSSVVLAVLIGGAGSFCWQSVTGKG